MLQNKNLVKPQGKIFRNGYLLKTIWEAYEGLSPRLKFTPEIKYKKNSNLTNIRENLRNFYVRYKLLLHIFFSTG